MMKATWYVLEDYPGPAPRRRWPVSSLVRKYIHWCCTRKHVNNSKYKHYVELFFFFSQWGCLLTFNESWGKVLVQTIGSTIMWFLVFSAFSLKKRHNKGQKP